MPRGRATTCARPGAEATLQEVATGWRFPIDHFTGNEDARHLSQHQIHIEFVPLDATR
jgi:hypothetical protein